MHAVCPNNKTLTAVQFAAVLNEKKAKIRQLRQRAEDLEQKIKEDERSVSLLAPFMLVSHCLTTNQCCEDAHP